jgi:hypothetical protein
VDESDIEDEYLVYIVPTHSVSIDYGYGSALSSYYTMNSGETWIANPLNGGTNLTLGRIGLDIVYADNSVIEGVEFGIMYDASTDNVLPFQVAATMTDYETILNGVNETDYTTESWAVYEAYLSSHQVTEYNTQEEVDLAAVCLANEQMSLIPKPTEANLIAYNNALEAVSSVDFTPNSWSPYQTVVDANKVTTANTQAEVDAATNNIIAAQANLVHIANFDMYYTTLYSTYTSDMYTAESWAPYQLVVSGITISVNSTQAEVDSAVAELAEAQNYLVLKPVEANLSMYYQVIESVLSVEHYTPYSWVNYQAVVNANIVTVSNTQEEVNTATQNIENAQIYLEPRADFTAYDTLLIQVDEWYYTIASWTVYKGIAASFDITLNSSQSEVDAAIEAIESAQMNLVPRANLANYEIALGYVTESDYTPQSWSEYWAVVITYEVSTENTQEEVDAVESIILAAQANLVPMADDTEYDAVMALVNESDYTVDSWVAYQLRLSELNITVNLSQYELDGIVDEILIAQSTLLVLKPAGCDLTSYNDILNTVLVESDYTAESWLNYQNTVAANVVTLSNTQEEVNAAVGNILSAQQNLIFAGRVALDEVLNVVEGLVYTDYSVETWQALVDTIMAPAYTQAAVVQQTADIYTKINELAKLPADLTEYNVLIASVNAENFTTTSWEIYQMQMNSTAVIMTTDNLKSEVAAAIQIITMYQGSLILAPVIDKTELNTWKDAVANYVQADYTVDSWNALQAALNAPENTVEDVAFKIAGLQIRISELVFANQPALDNVMAERELYLGFSFMFTYGSFNVLLETGDLPESTNEQVGIKVQAVTNALLGLVELSAQVNLNEYYNTLNNVKEIDCTPESWLNYTMVLNLNLVNDSSTQEQVNTCTSNILAAQVNLIQKPADLSQYYIIIGNVQEVNYTAESWAIYARAVNNSTVDVSMKQSEVNLIAAQLSTAQNLLVPQVSGVTLINYDDALSSVYEGDYTPESWAEYQLVVNANIVTIENTQNQIDSATANIIEAQIVVLVFKPMVADLSDYNMILDIVVESDYTVDSWEVYANTIAELGINENSTQEEVDAAEIVVFNAQQNLIALENIEMYYKITHIQNRGYTPESWSLYLDDVEENKLPENFSRAELDTAISNLYGRVLMLRMLFTKEDYDFIVNYAEVHRSEFDEEDMILFDELISNNQITVNSTPIQINDAVATLGQGLSNLHRLDGKANILAYALLESKTKEEMFTADSWSEYITDVEAHGNIADMDEKEYDNVLRHIIFVQKFLVEKGNLAAYNTLLASVRQSDYTELSWAIYQSVVNDNVVGNNSSREAVNSAIVNIRNAQFNLVRKPIDIGGGGSGGISLPPTPPAPPVPPVNSHIITINVRGNEVILPVRDTMTLRDNISGYINGYTDNTFKPDKSITRAETSQILSNIFKESGMLKPEIADINGQWYSQSVEQILSLGLMKGYEDKTFKPEKNLTRQEFAVTLVNMLDLSNMPEVGDKTFTDVDNSYGEESIKLLASLGILQGYDDRTFRPDTEITRAEVVVIINRLLGDRITPQGIPGNTIINFMDLEDCWAREEILRALKK